VTDARTLLESIVDNLLCADGLATTLALVGSNDDLALGIDDAVT
jgi:hypothetical protein